jgi:hypothetical protein
MEAQRDTQSTRNPVQGKGESQSRPTEGEGSKKSTDVNGNKESDNRPI